jgi:hypothetical protein
MYGQGLHREHQFDNIGSMRTVVAALGEAIDDAAGLDLDTVGDGELDAELVALLRLRHRLDAQIARRARCWNQRGVWRSDGSPAPWACLSRIASLAPGTAKTILRHGAALPSGAVPDIGGELVERRQPALGGRRFRVGSARYSRVLSAAHPGGVRPDTERSSCPWMP